jgi:uncharacterized protein (TIGR02996 family)
MLPPPFRAMDPADDLVWLAVADWLEEHGEAERAELTRLTRLLRRDLYHPDRPAREARQMELLAAGVEPCVATLTNSIGMEFVYIPGGMFLMGSPPEEESRYDNEGPVHEVEITCGFWMGKYPVTRAEYQAVTGTPPSRFSGMGRSMELAEGVNTSRFPVEPVSYEDALLFCTNLCGRVEEAREDRFYRLPTEAEWEYSCRGGPLSKRFHFGNTLSVNQADFNPKWHRPTSPGQLPSPVGRFPANAFGVHDMHGTVLEWCRDWYGVTYYENGDKRDPQGPRSGTARVLRGGSRYTRRGRCRAAARSWIDPGHRNDGCGFRVCFAAPA